MNRQVAKGDAELMMDAGIFMSTIASLVTDDLTEQGCDGNPFLSAFKLEGLMRGLKLAAHRLEERSEWLSETVEKEEKLAQATVERRQGQDTNRESNVRAECGTQRAA
ncbi:hypothetical protein HBO13_30635 [Pseudomonas lactis]|uniref:Uncharacterized protein n=1 Tax=Pseudomonas lactis TaxID=1615674 RepID=A0A7Y1M871_9PSED|nr:hypothetical protein [Pseudomonas lactis]NNA76994.1 hypothetical protein [Pseudomonas lactis]